MTQAKNKKEGTATDLTAAAIPPVKTAEHKPKNAVKKAAAPAPIVHKGVHYRNS